MRNDFYKDVLKLVDELNDALLSSSDPNEMMRMLNLAVAASEAFGRS